jgi:hypothetical protein
MEYKDLSTLEMGFDIIKDSPALEGTLQLIVVRPEVNERKEMNEGVLDESQGLIGDNWAARGSSETNDGSAHPEMQINIMNSRVARLISQDKSDWQMAGDQLFVDLNLNKDNVPPGTRLAVGEAILEVTAPPHTGCKKFAQRFGRDALKFSSTKKGRLWQLRGINAKVVKGGDIKIGDRVAVILKE